MDSRRLDWIFACLIAGTGLTWWLGERGGGGMAITSFVLGIAGLKSLYVILDYMALRGVRRFWQALVVGWLGVVLLLIAFAYRAAQT